MQKFDGNLGFESKDLNLSKTILIQLNKILSKFSGGLNIVDPVQLREYEDYIEFI